MSHSSTRAVITAIVSNTIVTILKFGAAILGGSAAMTNEAVHSLMDTLNQCFLLLGLREGQKPADQRYAFGHGQKKYMWNLWSAIGLFSIGAGLGLAHAWHSWHGRHEIDSESVVQIFGFSIEPIWMYLAVLGAGLLLEGYSFLVALKEFLIRMREEGKSNPFKYLFESDDPTLVAVVLEDSVAMLGLGFAALGISLTAITGHPEYDIIFSALIALMLGFVAFYLGWINMKFLVDIRDEDAEHVFREVVKKHPEVERYHDLRSIIIDESSTVLVAEIELREEAMVSGLAEQIEKRCDEINQSLPADKLKDESVQRYANSRAAVEAVIGRAEQIIDEIEAEIKLIAPQVAHITLEVEGVSG